MGLFSKKKEHLHYERDEEGKVVRVIKNGVDATEQKVEQASEPKYKSTKELMNEYYAKHPKKKPVPISKKLVKVGKTIDRRVLSKMSPIDPAAIYGFGGTSSRGSQRKSSKSKQYHIQGGIAYPIARKKKSKKKKTRRTSGMGNFDIFDNQGFWR